MPALPRRLKIALAAFGAGLVAVAGSAAVAAGDNEEPLFLSCGGHLETQNEVADEASVVWKLGCSGPVRSFAIVTNRPVDSFSPEIDAYGVDGAPLEFRCEGEIPAHGFRCVAKQPARLAYAQGSLTVPTEPCGKTPLRVAIVAAGADGQVGQPRRLVGPDCPRAQAAKRAVPTRKTRSTKGRRAR
ncbi:hypothetical protein SAMN02745716_0030 [Thermoleophilum album]|uniref:Ig-like domain-containing protein n=1 Tax=Thermoleophilum album TaxID=29539 RepID=A0A1H6FK45_THEAL|nr:hypothetical protein SAMN02745716_0030 [Thermoleophilum album]